jgi:hypothetical protein
MKNGLNNDREKINMVHIVGINLGVVGTNNAKVASSFL